MQTLRNSRGPGSLVGSEPLTCGYTSWAILGSNQIRHKSLTSGDVL